MITEAQHISGKPRQIQGKVKLKAPYSQGQGKRAAVDPM